MKHILLFIFLFIVHASSVEAHTDNVPYLLAEWGMAGQFDYNQDGKVNTFDFVIDAVHPQNPHPSPVGPSPTPTSDWPQLSFTRVVGGLSSPLHITHAADGSNRLFIIEQSGRIRIVKAGNLVTTPFLNITSRITSGGERGLLGLAFPPGYLSKGYFYVNYTNLSGHTVISRFYTSTNPDVADVTSEQIILTINQPFANHNGGTINFGPDGYLYIGTGDGGSGGDPGNRAQNPNELLGKLLRIDVESDATPYAIPSSNPFVGVSGYRGEIWALGLRNPWKFSFDRLTGDLYVADVGQNQYEEVNHQLGTSDGGENYGWKIMEGMHCFSTSACNQSGLTLPIAEYTHGVGCSVSGGHVYRRNLYPRMYGTYFYGDYCSGRIWGIKQAGTGWSVQELTDSTMSISTFGEDEAGNLYVANIGSGEIFEVTDSSPD